MSTEWYLTKKSYLSGFELEEIEEVYDTFDEILLQSPESYLVTVNDEIEEFLVIVQSTYNYNERRILFKRNDIQWGDIVILEEEEWLVTERPFFNKIHEKSHIELCNSEMLFKSLTDGVYEYDRLGNKIWIEEPKVVESSFPCVIDSISNLNTKTTTGHQINVPEGDMVVQISYTDNDLIRVSNEFTMFGDSYWISGIDRSKVHDGQGVLILIVSRKANNT